MRKDAFSECILTECGGRQMTKCTMYILLELEVPSTPDIDQFGLFTTERIMGDPIS